MYGAGRACGAVACEEHPTGFTLVLRSGKALPSWLRQADVFDRSGRFVRTGKTDLVPGTYFARIGSESGAESPGPHVVRRLLVLD
jgi:hypothetical protein